MPGDPALPARDWDFPPWQAARLLSGAARDAARAWTQPVPAGDILDVTWDLQQTLRDLGIALRRLSRYRPETEPDGQPSTVLHEPATHISRAGSVTVNAAAVLRDREVLDAANRHIARGLPAGGDPENGSAVVIAALGLADAAAMAYRIVGRSPSGTVQDRNAAVGAFMRVIDNLDMAVRNLAGHVPSPRSGTLAAAQPASRRPTPSYGKRSSAPPSISGSPAAAGRCGRCASAIRSCRTGWPGMVRSTTWSGSPAIASRRTPSSRRSSSRCRKPPRRGQRRALRIGYRANPGTGQHHDGTDQR